MRNFRGGHGENEARRRIAVATEGRSERQRPASWMCPPKRKTTSTAHGSLQNSPWEKLRSFKSLLTRPRAKQQSEGSQPGSNTITNARESYKRTVFGRQHFQSLYFQQAPSIKSFQMESFNEWTTNTPYAKSLGLQSCITDFKQKTLHYGESTLSLSFRFWESVSHQNDNKHVLSTSFIVYGTTNLTFTQDL